jgi:hypothetical protein
MASNGFDDRSHSRLAEIRSQWLRARAALTALRSEMFGQLEALAQRGVHAAELLAALSVDPDPALVASLEMLEGVMFTDVVQLGRIARALATCHGEIRFAARAHRQAAEGLPADDPAAQPISEGDETGIRRILDELDEEIATADGSVQRLRWQLFRLRLARTWPTDTTREEREALISSLVDEEVVLGNLYQERDRVRGLLAPDWPDGGEPEGPRPLRIAAPARELQGPPAAISRRPQRKAKNGIRSR